MIRDMVCDMELIEKAVELAGVKARFVGDMVSISIADMAVLLERTDKMQTAINNMNKIVNWEKAGPFISGVGGDVDGVPETIHVCYNYGVNYGGVYKLVHHGRTGQ